MLPRTRPYVKHYDCQTKWIYFLIKNLLEIYNTIWDKVIADIRKEFDSEPAHDKNFFGNQNKILR